jgi:hypothetical protein
MHKTTDDQHPRGALPVSRIQKNRFPEVLACVLVEYRQGKNQTACSLGNLNTAGATLCGTSILQRAVELRKRSLILLRCPPEPPFAEMALRRGAPAVYFHHAGENCTVGNLPPKGNLGLKRTRTDEISKKFD